MTRSDQRGQPVRTLPRYEAGGDWKLAACTAYELRARRRDEALRHRVADPAEREETGNVEIRVELERDARGLPSRVRTELHLSVGPLTKDFDVLMAVTVEPPATVKLAKVGGNAKFDVIWRLNEGENTRIELELDASLDVPRFLPLGDVGNSVAQGFVAAASAELARRALG